MYKKSFRKKVHLTRKLFVLQNGGSSSSGGSVCVYVLWLLLRQKKKTAVANFALEFGRKKKTEKPLFETTKDFCFWCHKNYFTKILLWNTNLKVNKYIFGNDFLISWNLSFDPQEGMS